MKTKTPNNTPIRPAKMYGISRIDQPEKHNHGYYVRVYRCASKFFADKVHGGKRRAFEAAESHRNALFATLDVAAKLRAAKPRKKTK